jgi:hypothetical protein
VLRVAAVAASVVREVKGDYQGQGLTVDASKRLVTLLNLLPRNDVRTHIP